MKNKTEVKGLGKFEVEDTVGNENLRVGAWDAFASVLDVDGLGKKLTEVVAFCDSSDSDGFWHELDSKSLGGFFEEILNKSKAALFDKGVLRPSGFDAYQYSVMKTPEGKIVGIKADFVHGFNNPETIKPISYNFN